jgi:uncharacterized membrane protein
MSFSTPLALFLLLLIPAVIWLGYPQQRFRRRRDIASVAIRAAMIALLVLALAGAQVTQSTNRLAVVFLVDASDSVDPITREGAISLVRDAINGMGSDDLAGVVLFGQRPQVERPITDSHTLGPVRSQPNGGNTDLAAAVRLALAMFPSDAARRIVVMSDGQPTLGDSEAAAQLAAAAGVEISYVPLREQDSPDVRVTRFEAPSAVPEGQQFDLSLTVVADQATPARIDVFASGEIILSEETDLRQGTNNRTLTLTAQSSGFRDFTVVVEPEGGDGYYQNNRLATFSQVIGPARVLVVGDESETSYLAAALREAGLTVDEQDAGQLPINVAGLVPYESVILANVPTDRLSERQMQAMQTYVRDLGGGLVVVGGPNAYGPGGYFETPLEETLPVSMKLTDQERQPRLSIAYVIDRSGSMQAIGPDGQPLIELAKAAINRSIDFLQEADRAGVATFDSTAYWVAEFQNVANREELRRLIGTLRPSGGTDIGAGMRLVAGEIVNQPTEAKHIILLSDGIANRAGLIELATDLRSAGVTLTSIALGDENELMRDLSEAGGGSFRVVTDASTIPSVFAQETVLATRSYIFEDPFTPSLTARSPIMQSITALPALQGYVGTTPKDAALVVLRGPEPYRDPLLAAWQYGLGRSVAFTSDATARWGTDWVTWDDYTRFWNQAVRWTMTEGGSEALETRVVMEETQARVIVDARDDSGAFLNGLELGVSVVEPGLESQQLVLRQVAPGRYEATFDPSGEGAYLLAVNGAAGETAINQTSGWVMSYSREYLASRGQSVLPRMAAITGGRAYTDGLAPAFEHTIAARSGSLPIFPLLLLLALLLLPFDVAIRRLLVQRSDLARLATALRLRAQPATEAATGRMAALMDARERARAAIEADEITTAANTASTLRSRLKTSDTKAAAAPPSRPPAREPLPARQSAPPPLSAEQPPVAPAAPKPADPAPTSSAQTEESDNIGARLLKRRKGDEKK